MGLFGKCDKQVFSIFEMLKAKYRGSQITSYNSANLGPELEKAFKLINCYVQKKSAAHFNFYWNKTFEYAKDV